MIAPIIRSLGENDKSSVPTKKCRTIDSAVLAALNCVNRLEKYMEKNVYTNQSFHAE